MPLPRPTLLLTALVVSSLAFVVALAVLAGCPKSASKGTALEEIQYAYSAAIRWGDFEGAWNLVDPEVRKERPLTDIDFSRYKQVQISGYRDQGGTVSNFANVGPGVLLSTDFGPGQIGLRDARCIGGHAALPFTKSRRGFAVNEILEPGMIVRHPGAVSSSLHRRFHYGFAEAVAYWSETNQEMLRALRVITVERGIELAQRFRDIVVSGEEKLLKPELNSMRVIPESGVLPAKK